MCIFVTYSFIYNIYILIFKVKFPLQVSQIWNPTKKEMRLLLLMPGPVLHLNPLKAVGRERPLLHGRLGLPAQLLEAMLGSPLDSATPVALLDVNQHFYDLL